MLPTFDPGQLDAFVRGARQRALALLGEGPARGRTEEAVHAFMAGAEAWAADDPDRLARLEPFAWEGAGLAAALLGNADVLLDHPGSRTTLVFVGIGWARCLTHGAAEAPPAAWLQRHGEAAWSMLDGHGFAAELFRSHRTIRVRPGSPIERAIDQGIGRAFYFVHGGQPDAIRRRIDSLGRARAPALWLGVGIASRFTDGLDPASRELLRVHGGAALREGEARASVLLADS